MYLWLKAFHVIFMVTWFAGLFYLPRLFIYHAMDENKNSFELFKIMEKRLFGIMTIGAALTVIFGTALVMMNWNYLFSTPNRYFLEILNARTYFLKQSLN